MLAYWTIRPCLYNIQIYFCDLRKSIYFLAVVVNNKHPLIPHTKANCIKEALNILNYVPSTDCGAESTTILIYIDC